MYHTLNPVKMTQKLCFLMVHTAGTWGPKYKTLRSACEVLVVKNKMGELNTSKRLSNHKHITSPIKSFTLRASGPGLVCYGSEPEPL